MSEFLELFYQNWQIVISFFVIAVLYSSVGFGGGSSYLALLSLFSLPFLELRALALICNIVVVSGNVYVFQKHKMFNWKKVLPLAFFSVPFAFLGGFIPLKEDFFFILLALSLISAAFVMLWQKTNEKQVAGETKTWKNASIGSTIGFLSGIVGIGGGIFLAPWLHLTAWDTAKKIAAMSSFFILVNSISGLVGQSLNPNFNLDISFTFLLAFTVFLGGQIGSRMNLKVFSPKILKRATAVLIFFVAVRLLLKSLLPENIF